MDGYRMRYLRAGNGPPLVLIHGLLGYSFSWRFNWQALAKKYTVYAVDLLGIGYSDRPQIGAVPFDLPRTAERMLLWMEQTGIRDAALLGTSHGGGLALAMAASDRKNKSGLISKLILVAAVNPWTTVGHHRARLFSTRIGGLMLKAIAPWLGISRSVMLERMYGDRSKITLETLTGYRKPLLLPRSIDYGMAIAKSWGNDLPHLVGCVETVSGMPVLLIWGDHDRLVPLASGQELKRHLKGAEMVVMKSVGHLPYEESPGEFNRVLLEFLG
jgi:pimeloyl-ACP methyl ester carboxylesterase